MTFEEYDDENKRKLTLNAKAKNNLTCTLGKTEYSRFSICSGAFKMWKLLEMIHEGTSLVKNSKINLLITQYERFKMTNDETMVTCSTG